jgi:phosphohistidine phosphatase
MKTLFLLRHAKSSWDNSSLADFERPLNERGLRAAPLIGATILQHQFQIDLIISSSAKRAEQTALLVKEAARINCEIQFDAGIYEASSQKLRQIVTNIGKEIESILLVGHNPGFEVFLEFLTHKSHQMPTAALAVIDLRIDEWNKVAADTGKLRMLLRPKELTK